MTRDLAPGRAAAWVAHLRAGGSTPWASWTGTTDDPAPRLRPGAQQLELLRRLNETGPVPEPLVERVLTASAAGRGRHDLELVGAGPASPFGPPPVDPAELPADELLRVAALLIAEDLAAQEPEEPADDLRQVVGTRVARVKHLGRGSWLRPRRTTYRLVGDPWRAEALRADLVRRGRPPGGRGALVLVVADDLATMLADLWTDRCFSTGGAVPAWGSWLATVSRARRLAPGADPARAAALWSDRVGRERVRIVLDQRELAPVFGVRGLASAPPPSADAVELARRVSRALGLLVTPVSGRRILRERLLPRLLERPGPPVVVPPDLHRWVHRRSIRLREEVRRGDYRVLGEVDALVSHPRALAAAGARAPAGTRHERVLGLAIDLLRTPTRQEAAP